eukprot:1647401-Rhodomonas_salina.2
MHKGGRKGKGAHQVAKGQWGGVQILASATVARVRRQNRQGRHNMQRGGAEGMALTWQKRGSGEGSVDGNLEDGRCWPLRQFEFPKNNLRTATHLQFSTIH